VLQPGDALYLPRGYLHAAEALGETSVHLTVGVHVWTRRHLLEQVLSTMGDAEELRSSLPLGLDVTDPQALKEELAQTVRAFAERLTAVGPEQIAAGMAGAALSSVKAAPVAPIAQASAATGVGASDRLRWRPALRVTVSRRGDRLLVQKKKDIRNNGKKKVQDVKTIKYERKNKQKHQTK